MTSKLRNKLICILFLLFSFVLFFSTNNYFAKADTVTLGSLQNADFNWSNDISLEYSENTEYSKESFDIKFDFFLKNSKHSNIRNFITYYKNWWGTTLVQTFNYNFTLYAATDESSSDTLSGQTINAFPIGSYTIEFDVIDDIIDKYVFFTSYNSSFNTNFYLRFPSETISASTHDKYTSGESTLLFSDFENDEVGLSFYSDNHFSLIVTDPSPNISYFVNFSAQYWTITDKGGMFREATREVTYSEGQSFISTSPHSVISYLTDCNNNGVLEFNDENANAYALSLLNYHYRTVDFHYLSQIGETPFAYRKKVTFTYPTFDDSIDMDLILYHLELQDIKYGDMTFLDAKVHNYDELPVSNSYCANYYPSVWLRSSTESGHYADYFIDCNKSYYDFYYPLVRDNIISQGLYDYLFNQFVLKYPELTYSEFYSPSEIYGFWGYFVTPRDYSLDEAFVSAFGIKTEKQGYFDFFSFDSEFNKTSYEKLLGEDYKYSFLETLWATSLDKLNTGAVNCKVYISIFNNSGEAFVGEGGQTDKDNPGGAIHNNVTIPFFGAMANGFEAFLSLFSNVASLKSFYMVIIVIALVLLIIWLLVKVFSGFTLNIKNISKEPKKKRKNYTKFKGKKYKKKK